jgi:hypothetical protein
MKKLRILVIMIASMLNVHSQNVGIDVPNPTKKLSVNGTVVIDYNSANSGSLDSAALLFGPNANVGITSNKNSGLINYQGLDIWTNSIKRISINEAGNVGVGITGPLHKLHVGGEIVANDYIHAGSYLRAGSTPFSNSYRLQINNGNSLLNGRLSVGGTAATNDKLYVNGTGSDAAARFDNGSVIVEDDIHAFGNINSGGQILGDALAANNTLWVLGHAAIGGALDNNYKLRVYDGNARIGGDFHATGNAAIGGAVDNNFRLRIYDGNARIGGNTEVTGELTAGSAEVAGQLTAGSVTIDNTLTIGGKGSVRSNGPSPLRIGFDSKAIDVFINNNGRVSVTLNITDFSGGYDDARVIFSHAVSDNGNTLDWGEIIITPMAPDSSTDTCLIWLTNKTGENGILKGTLYFTTIVKN